ncbi:MAG: phosphatase PAP2 family protein [Pseudomonadota bacterium]|nr:phosphatase PAP2 family protein [Pseudomonadota bacterium]
MPKKLFVRATVVAALLLLCLIAGIVGGAQFVPDVAMIHSLEAVRASSPGLTTLAILVTHAGSVFGTLVGGLGVAGWLAWRGQRWLATVLGATVLGERLVVDGLKLLMDRARPSFDLHPVVTHSSSFPSGHAGNSMAVFLAIALIAVPRANRVRAVIAALVATLLIGITRSYLGVHWPSDVIGGWSLGAAIAIIGWTIAESRRSAAAQ